VAGASSGAGAPLRAQVPPLQALVPLPAPVLFRRSQRFGRRCLFGRSCRSSSAGASLRAPAPLRAPVPLFGRSCRFRRSCLFFRRWSLLFRRLCVLFRRSCRSSGARASSGPGDSSGASASLRAPVPRRALARLFGRQCVFRRACRPAMRHWQPSPYTRRPNRSATAPVVRPAFAADGRPTPNWPRPRDTAAHRRRLVAGTLGLRPEQVLERHSMAIIPSRRAPPRGPLAQLAEQLTLNQPVPGSSPGGLTKQPF
jgi:hypothetical protein